MEETLGPVRLPTGQAILGIVRDITERKRAQLFRDIGREILQILNQTGTLKNSLQHVVATLKASTGVDAVGIRLQYGEDYPYFSQTGFSKDFLTTENSLVNHGEGDICNDSEGRPSLECTCGLVILGRTDPIDPVFTGGGSVWTNNLSSLIVLPADEDPRTNPRNVCIQHGYRSMATRILSGSA